MSGDPYHNPHQGYPSQPGPIPPPPPGAYQMPEGYAPQPYGGPPAMHHWQPGPNGMPPEAFGGFWIRFLAAIVDSLVLTVPSLIVTAVVYRAFGFNAMAALDVSRMQTLMLEPGYQTASNVSTVLQIILAWSYFAIMHSTRGATLGKMALGLRVIDENSNFPGFGRATGRYLATILSSCLCLIGYIMAGFHGQKRSLHDLIAGTWVVRKEFASTAETQQYAQY